MKFFDLDSPLMQILNKVADLMILNLLTVLFCIPVITVGPALTAMHYVALKMARNEECYIARDFFKSFRLNLRQGIVLWLIELFIILVLAGDFLILNQMDISFGKVLRIVLIVIAVVAMFTFMFVFPVLAKFDNPVLRTVRNAFFIGILQFPKTILMMILSVVPLGLFLLFPQITPIIFLFGLTVPAWLSAKLYSGYFKRLEDQITEAAATANPPAEGGAPEEDERIFKDELDESLVEDSRIG